MNKKYAGLDFPAWFDGKDVNEAAFCREFLSKNKLIYADNAFFTPDGRLTDPLLLKEKIYAELECCAAKNIPRTISNIVEIMKLAAHAGSFPPKPDEIHVQNGTLRIDGSFLAGRPEIVRSRFPIDLQSAGGEAGCLAALSLRSALPGGHSQPFRSISAIASFPAPRGSA